MSDIVLLHREQDDEPPAERIQVGRLIEYRYRVYPLTGEVKPEPIACPRCEVELGFDADKCPRAKGSDLCMECANWLMGMDEPDEEC